VKAKGGTRRPTNRATASTKALRTFAEVTESMRADALDLFNVKEPADRHRARALAVLIHHALGAPPDALDAMATALARRSAKKAMRVSAVMRNARAQVARILAGATSRLLVLHVPQLTECVLWTLRSLPPHVVPQLPSRFDAAEVKLSGAVSRALSERRPHMTNESFAEYLLTRCARACGCTRNLFAADDEASRRKSSDSPRRRRACNGG
jgi:hypothetical protein